MIIKGKKYSWTQPVCDFCWVLRHAERDPLKVNEAYRCHEVCCFCGNVNRSGIYERVDPRSVPHPRRED